MQSGSDALHLRGLEFSLGRGGRREDGFYRALDTGYGAKTLQRRADYGNAEGRVKGGRVRKDLRKGSRKRQRG